MSTHSRKLIAVASLLAFSTVLNGCAINPEANKKNGVLETACSNTVKDFDLSTFPPFILTTLPTGVYAHSNAEVYVKNTIASSAGNSTTDVNEVQVLETPTTDVAAPFSTSTLCRETTGNFHAYFEQVPLLVGFTHFANGDFTPSMNSYSVIYNTDLQPAFSVSATPASSRTNPTAIASTIINYWNTSYRFVKTAANTYVFLGIRTDSASGRTVYGRAVYTRTDLPPGTI